MRQAAALPRGRPNLHPVATAQQTWVQDTGSATFVTVLVWVLIALMTAPDGFNYSNTTNLVGSGSALTRVLWLAVPICALPIVVFRSGLVWLVSARMNRYFMLFVLAAAASVAWSIEPGVTLKRMTRLITILLVCYAFSTVHWHERRFQEVMRPLFTSLLVGSILFGLIYPKLAIHQETAAEVLGAWHGLALHKNQLGGLSSIGAILWFHGWLAREVSTSRALAGGLISVTTLLLSRSSTALVVTLFVFGLLLLMLRSPANLRRWTPLIITAFTAALLTYALAVLRLVPGLDIILQPIILFTGKDLTFTGRSEIWALMAEHIRLHPLLGTGYGAFWTGPNPGSPSYIFVTKLYFYPTSAHNGYLEIINDLGILGFVCLAGYLVTHLKQSLQLMKIDRAQASLYIALFFQQAISNLSESHWLSVLSCNFVIVTLASFALARSLLELDLRRYFGNPLLAARDRRNQIRTSR